MLRRYISVGGVLQNLWITRHTGLHRLSIKLWHIKPCLWKSLKSTNYMVRQAKQIHTIKGIKTEYFGLTGSTEPIDILFFFLTHYTDLLKSLSESGQSSASEGTVRNFCVCVSHLGGRQHTELHLAQIKFMQQHSFPAVSHFVHHYQSYTAKNMTELQTQT